MQILGNNNYAQGIEYKRKGELIGFMIDDNSDDAKKIANGYKFTVDMESQEITIIDEETDETKVNKYQEFALNKYFFKNEVLNIVNKDFTLIGLKKVSEWAKGRKTNSQYRDPESDALIVKKTFTDIFDEDGIFIGLDIQFDWFDDNEEIVASKTERNYLDRIEAGEHLRKRRQRAMDKLMISAKIYDKKIADAGITVQTTLVQAMGILFDHYKNQISKFIETGSDYFKDALNNETIPQINGILDVVANPANNFTIKDSILFEI